MKPLRIIYYIFIASVAAIAVLLVVSVFPITGNFKTMIVQSGSMQPEIKMGGIVVVKPADDYKIGEIITFQSVKNKEPITHRIYDIKIVGGEPLYITKGDANDTPDARKVARDEIIGKILFSVPYFGFAVDFAKKPLGFASIIIIPTAIIIFGEVKKIYGEVKKKKTKKEE